MYIWYRRYEPTFTETPPGGASTTESWEGAPSSASDATASEPPPTSVETPPPGVETSFSPPATTEQVPQTSSTTPFTLLTTQETTPTESSSTPTSELTAAVVTTGTTTTTSTPTSEVEKSTATPAPSETSGSTVSYTIVTTTVNGTLTTLAVPTTLAGTSSNLARDGNSRTALIAGLTSGLVVLLLLLLGAAFAYRRHRRRRQLELLAAAEEKKVPKEQSGLLAGEGFDDDFDDADGGVIMRPHADNNPPRSQSPTMSILKTRASETGSIFREDVWPPPTDELVDPITRGSSRVDLGRVVDDVMGPHDHSRQGTDNSVDSTSPLMASGSHSRGPSLSSQYMDQASYSTPTLVHGYTGPDSYPSFTRAAGFASSSSLPQQGLPPLIAPPPAMMSTITSSPVSIHRPSSPSNLFNSPSSPASPSDSSPLVKPSRLSSSTPRTSSPLARRLSQDAKTWLTRRPRPGPAGSESSKLNKATL
ncbi:hypothetical protein DFP72DRAFT_295726 [Ephemerocybe angulata]|uniref:Uncharacterized protein n=1 Tax=Ephemerocybe angulata TaxID=980116 RepID=A0A8H6I1K8_9AGAR|nr:hypothetical protein DFP72DRAFT_295726 [Tulosesus angulatus]